MNVHIVILVKYNRENLTGLKIYFIHKHWTEERKCTILSASMVLFHNVHVVNGTSSWMQWYSFRCPVFIMRPNDLLYNTVWQNLSWTGRSLDKFIHVFFCLSHFLFFLVILFLFSSEPFFQGFEEILYGFSKFFVRHKNKIDKIIILLCR